MVRPARLVEVISQVTGFPLASVVDIDRKLVMAGLRRKGGRGPHVVRMNTHDAARLLTAVLGSSQSTAAADAVRRYEATRVDAEPASEWGLAAAELDDLTALARDHSFVEGLEVLIASAATGSMSRVSSGAGRASSPRIEVFGFTGATRGHIRLSGLSSGKVVSRDYAVPAAGEEPAASSRQSGDLEQSRRITERTVGAVAALFRMEAGRDGA